MRDTFSMRIKVNQVAGRPVITAVNGRPVTEPDLVGRFSINEAGAIIENGEADVLYTNDGHGHFAPVPFTGGSFLDEDGTPLPSDRKSTRLNSSHRCISYAVFCLKKKKKKTSRVESV